MIKEVFGCESQSLKGERSFSNVQISPTLTKKNKIEIKDDNERKTKTKKKSKWTPEEDKILAESVGQHGKKNWITVASLLPGRNPKQCRERWTSKLDPTLVHDPFTEEEDKIILEKQEQIGSCWSKMTKFLPGRNPIAIKNRYNLLLRHRALENASKANGEENGKSENINLKRRPKAKNHPPKTTKHATLKQKPDDVSVLDPFNSLSSNGFLSYQINFPFNFEETAPLFEFEF